MQKVTKFEGIQIEKVFFSNKNIYGNLMLSTCKQIDKSKNTTKASVSPTFSDEKNIELDNPATNGLSNNTTPRNYTNSSIAAAE